MAPLSGGCPGGCAGGGEQLRVLSSAQVRPVSGGMVPQASRSSGYTGTYRLLVRGKKINQNTLLATDYLNHFNEIIMLLEMLPSMPECYGDAAEWRPKRYAAHIRDRKRVV